MSAKAAPRSGADMRDPCADIREARMVSTAIAVPIVAAYAFARRPENIARWATGLLPSLQPTASGWLADTPGGAATVRFSEDNLYGVVDHWLRTEGGDERYMSLRLIPNRAGTEAVMVLFRQPGMDDAGFEREVRLVEGDLSSLKRLLEEVY